MVQQGTGAGGAGPEGEPPGWDGCYHFLLPDPGMVGYRDTTAKELEPESFAHIAKWRRSFFRAFTPEQTAELERLSSKVNELWAMHAEQLGRDHRETEDTRPVWGQPAPTRERRTATRGRTAFAPQGIFGDGEGVRTASPYRRLKLVMDYCVALWFWPVREARRLARPRRVPVTRSAWC